MGASQYGQFKFLLPEFSQMIFSPGPLIYKLREGLKNYKVKDYLLLTGDSASPISLIIVGITSPDIR